jgi:hypothetical protein
MESAAFDCLDLFAYGGAPLTRMMITTVIAAPLTSPTTYTHRPVKLAPAMV